MCENTLLASITAESANPQLGKTDAAEEGRDGTGALVDSKYTRSWEWGGRDWRMEVYTRLKGSLVAELYRPVMVGGGRSLSAAGFEREK